MTNLPELAFSNYEFFKSKSGSAHIATFSSQLNLIELLKQNKCQSVLDYGSGIGTLSKLMENIGIPSIYGYERSEWCKE
jgi:ribosomal protein L11 methylase PrmA